MVRRNRARRQIMTDVMHRAVPWASRTQFCRFPGPRASGNDLGGQAELAQTVKAGLAGSLARSGEASTPASPLRDGFGQGTGRSCRRPAASESAGAIDVSPPKAPRAAPLALRVVARHNKRERPFATI